MSRTSWCFSNDLDDFLRFLKIFKDFSRFIVVFFFLDFNFFPMLLWFSHIFHTIKKCEHLQEEEQQVCYLLDSMLEAGFQKIWKVTCKCWPVWFPLSKYTLSVYRFLVHFLVKYCRSSFRVKVGLVQCLKSQIFSNSLAKNRHDLFSKVEGEVDGT